MSRQNIEAIIRDKLAQNLGVIEPGLVLIQDEYRLENSKGAAGFVDLFARDQQGNLVVIEVKRSDAAAREAITELAKYAALLRAAKNIRSSELRLIVVSTAWHELLVPFSEFFHNTAYQLTGYRLAVDSEYNPVAVDRVQPLPNVEGRKLCRRHNIYYYTSQQEMEEAEEILRSESERTGILDFVVVRFGLKFDDPYYHATCGLYYAQQLRDRNFYEEIFRRVASPERYEEVEAYISDMDEEDATDELADDCTGEFGIPRAYYEIGYPERFYLRIAEGHWNIIGVSRFGIFSKDERLTDDHLIADLEGLTGTSLAQYQAMFRLENRAKLDEVREALRQCLFYNDTWRHAIEDILRYAQRKANRSIIIHIYNPDDLLETIWRSAMDGPMRYEPHFLVVVEGDDKDAVDIFEGRMRWHPNEAKFRDVLVSVFSGRFEEYIMKRALTNPQIYNKEVMKCLGFEYAVDYTSQSNVEEQKLRGVVIRGTRVESHENNRLISFIEFLDACPPVIEELVRTFNKHFTSGGLFTFGPDDEEGR